MSLLPDNNIYVIVPAFNESTVISEVIDSLLGKDYHVVLVDDGSAKKITRGTRNNKLTLIRHKVNLGQGAAIQTGIEFAKSKQATYIVTFDADGQHDVNDIPALLHPLMSEEADISLASRFIKRGSHNAGTSRKIVLKIARWINYFFTGLYLTDAHNGLRAMTLESARKISLKENRMAHASEILFIIRKQQLRFKEVPANVVYTDYSKSKGQSIFNSIRIFFDLVLHKLFE